MKPAIDIILTYFQTDHLVFKCLDRLLSSEWTNFGIIIVDNTRNSKSKFNGIDDRIRVIEGPTAGKGSFSRGRHHPDGIIRGIESSNAEYITLVEADCWPIHNDWVEVCMDHLKKPNVELVGIQDEASIPLTFHFLRRDTIKKHKFLYNVKPAFGKDVCYVDHPEAFVPRRKKWRFGEHLPIKIYKNGGYTVGLLPTSACVCETDVITGSKWIDYLTTSSGILYGDMIFHYVKSYRRRESVKNKMPMYKNDKYLLRRHCPSSDEKWVLNDGRHRNSVYVEDNLNERI